MSSNDLNAKVEKGSRSTARSYRVVAVVVAGGVAALLVVVGVAVLVRGLDEGPDAPAGAVQSAAHVRDDVSLPELIELLEAAEPLPAEGAVGRGALLTQCRDCGIQLILADGDRFELSVPGAAVLSYSLSPDGRWLTMPDDGAAVVRELTGDLVHRMEVPPGRGLAAWAWSPDSQLLLFAELPAPPSDADLPPTEYRLLDVSDGTEIEIAGQPGQEFVAVLPSGRLLALESVPQQADVRTTRTEVHVVDPESAGSADVITVDAGEWLEQGESLAAKANALDPGGVELLVAPDGDGMLLVVFSDGVVPAALLRTDGAGHVEQRVGLAGLDPQRVGWVAGQLGDAVVIAEVQATRDVGYLLTLSTVSDAGLVELATLAGANLVRVAGTAAHGGSVF